MTWMRTRLRDDDSGFAMIIVMGVMFVLTLLVMLSVAAATESTKGSGIEADYHSAQDAAQAGVQHYLKELNRNDTYFTTAQGSSSAAPTWTNLPSSVTGSRARFRLQVLSPPSEVLLTGQIRLQSTGDMDGERRTVDVTLGKPSFMEYLYFSVFETSPPITAKDPAWVAQECEEPFEAPRDAACELITFSTGDEFDGPVYSQDRIVMSGSPVFKQRVQTAWKGRGTDADGGPFWEAFGTATPQFQGGVPSRLPVEFPNSNDKLAQQALSGNGCVYTGPTRILFNSDGTMTVTSPYSGALGACGTFSGPSFTQTVAVPNERMILVRSGSPGCDPTARAAVKFPVAGDDALPSSSKLGYSCNQGDVFVEGVLKGRTTLQAQNNLVVTGNLTYASGPSGSDMLGLVGDSTVSVYHPVTCSTASSASLGIVNGRSINGRCEGGTNVTRSPADAASTTEARVITAYPMTNVTIHAVILATQNGFIVQNALIGTALGQLQVHGAIAQRFRGHIGGNISGVHSRGYTKNYTYDERAAYAPPPFMADLAVSAWGVKRFAERTG